MKIFVTDVSHGTFVLLSLPEMQIYLQLLPEFEKVLEVASLFTQQLLSILKYFLLDDNPCLAHGLVYGGSYGKNKKLQKK
jgi:hypothetical protein